VKVILFGATGMVGQAVLRECLLDPRIESVLVVARTVLAVDDPRVSQVVHEDFLDVSSLAPHFTGLDACFFCVGVSANGMSEPAYRRVTYFITMAVARELAGQNAGLRFLYISGAGTDSTEHGRLMWARVKGETENAVLSLPFHGYALRPGYIQPVGGVRSKNRLYRNIYRVTGGLYPLLARVLPRHVIASDQLARAMITVAADGAPARILDNSALLRLAGGADR
jgi:uncharacterized protein YbjT (DUF2867 family)